MKRGRTLQELASEIERQAETKLDYVAPTNKLQVETETDTKGQGTTSHLSINLSNGGGKKAKTQVTTLKPLAIRQIGDRLQIPAQYMDRIRTNDPALFDHTVNYLFENHVEQRMVRTLDGATRAFLSDRYRPLDNVDLAEHVLNEMLGMPGLNVDSCELTETRLYLRAVWPRQEIQIREIGEVLQAGICISNSEVGAGALRVEPLVYILSCKNGMIAQDHGVKKHHVGRASGELGESYQLYSDKTLALDDAAFFGKVVDTVRATLRDAERFKQIAGSIRHAATEQIEGDPIKAVEVVANKFKLNDGERSGILQRLIKGGNLTQWGVSQAMTNYAQSDDVNFDRAIELEGMGHKVITLPKTDWQHIAKAA